MDNHNLYPGTVIPSASVLYRSRFPHLHKYYRKISAYTYCSYHMRQVGKKAFLTDSVLFRFDNRYTVFPLINTPHPHQIKYAAPSISATP